MRVAIPYAGIAVCVALSTGSSSARRDNALGECWWPSLGGPIMFAWIGVMVQIKLRG